MNEELATTDFGSDLTLFVLLFVTAFDDPQENERWARGHTKLGRSRKDEQGQVARIQSFGIPVSRAEMKYLAGAGLADHLAETTARAFSQEPAKSAKGLDWPAFRRAVLTCLSSAFAGAA